MANISEGIKSEEERKWLRNESICNEERGINMRLMQSGISMKFHGNETHRNDLDN
jgi:hypothetical protein